MIKKIVFCVHAQRQLLCLTVVIEPVFKKCKLCLHLILLCSILFFCMKCNTVLQCTVLYIIYTVYKTVQIRSLSNLNSFFFTVRSKREQSETLPTFFSFNRCVSLEKVPIISSVFTSFIRNLTMSQTLLRFSKILKSWIEIQNSQYEFQ